MKKHGFDGIPIGSEKKKKRAGRRQPSAIEQVKVPPSGERREEQLKLQNVAAQIVIFHHVRQLGLNERLVDDDSAAGLVRRVEAHVFQQTFH